MVSPTLRATRRQPAQSRFRRNEAAYLLVHFLPATLSSLECALLSVTVKDQKGCCVLQLQEGSFASHHYTHSFEVL